MGGYRRICILKCVHVLIEKYFVSFWHKTIYVTLQTADSPSLYLPVEMEVRRKKSQLNKVDLKKKESPVGKNCTSKQGYKQLKHSCAVWTAR